MSIALASCCRMATCGSATSAIRASVSIRRSASAAEFECTVVIDPAWPVFSACSMSSASAPRTSPTMMRSGRMRSALRTSWRMVTSPLPSTFGGRLSRRSTCGCWSRSSAASSIVMIRSARSTNEDSTLSRVVLPDPVPPLTTMLLRPSTRSRRKDTASAVTVALSTRSSAPNAWRRNRLIVSSGPSRLSGGITQFTRDPSGKRASASGAASSTRRPSGLRMRSIRCISSSSEPNDTSVSTMRPRRSTCTTPRPLTMISSTSGSSISGSSGPEPDGAGHDPVHERGPLAVVERQRLLRQQGGDATAQRRPGRSRRRRSAPPRQGAAAGHARRRRRCSTSEPGRGDRYRAQAPGVSSGARHDPDLAREVVGGGQQHRLTQRGTQGDAAVRRPAVVTERPGRAGFESDHGHPLERQEGARRSAPAVGRDQHVHRRPRPQHLRHRAARRPPRPRPVARRPTSGPALPALSGQAAAATRRRNRPPSGRRQLRTRPRPPRRAERARWREPLRDLPFGQRRRMRRAGVIDAPAGNVPCRHDDGDERPDLRLDLARVAVHRRNGQARADRRRAEHRGGAAARRHERGGAGARPAGNSRRAGRRAPEPDRPPPAAGPRSPSQTDPGPYAACRRATRRRGARRPDRDRGAPARSAGGRRRAGRIRPAPRSSTQTETWLPLMRPVDGHGATAVLDGICDQVVERLRESHRHTRARASRRRASRARPAGRRQAATRSTRRRLVPRPPGGRPTRGAGRTGPATRRAPPRGLWQPTARGRIRGAGPRRAIGQTFPKAARAGTAQRRSRSARRAARGSTGPRHAGDRSGDGS